MADVNALELISVFERVDLPLPKDPREWTIGGHPLSEDEAAIVASATPEDWRAIHDLAVLDGVDCRCGRHR